MCALKTNKQTNKKSTNTHAKSAIAPALSHKNSKDITHKWDLSALFPHKNAIESFSKQTKKEALDFEARYKGGLRKLSPKEFSSALERYEELIERIERVLTYAFLVFAEDTTQGNFYAKYELESSEIYEHLVFFELEFCDIDSTKINAFIAQCPK